MINALENISENTLKELNSLFEDYNDYVDACLSWGEEEIDKFPEFAVSRGFFDYKIAEEWYWRGTQ